MKTILKTLLVFSFFAFSVSVTLNNANAGYCNPYLSDCRISTGGF